MSSVRDRVASAGRGEARGLPPEPGPLRVRMGCGSQRVSPRIVKNDEKFLQTCGVCLKFTLNKLML